MARRRRHGSQAFAVLLALHFAPCAADGLHGLWSWSWVTGRKADYATSTNAAAGTGSDSTRDEVSLVQSTAALKRLGARVHKVEEEAEAFAPLMDARRLEGSDNQRSPHATSLKHEGILGHMHAEFSQLHVRTRSANPFYAVLFALSLLVVFGAAWLACLPEGAQAHTSRFRSPVQHMKSQMQSTRVPQFGSPAPAVAPLQFLPPSHGSERSTLFAGRSPANANNCKPSPWPTGPTSSSSASPGMRDPQFSFGGGVSLPSADPSREKSVWPQVMVTARTHPRDGRGCVCAADGSG